MGCDIHCVAEVRRGGAWQKVGKVFRDRDYPRWSREPLTDSPIADRDYELFSVLANVRNYHGIPFIAGPKGLPDDMAPETAAFCRDYDHSPSWLTLRELKAYDTEQEFEDRDLILSRDDTGKITGTCRDTTGPHYGPVGRRKVFALWGREKWDTLIRELSALSDGDDEGVRIVFHFDS